jgi:monoamine oxidase
MVIPMSLHAPRPDGRPWDPAPPISPATTVVVGAGLSGLVAASLLERLGLDVTLLEARERVGGRVLGWASEDGTHRFDLGPAWIWPEVNPRLADWLGGLGLALFEQQVHGTGLIELPSQAVRRHPTGFAQQPPAMRIVGGTACLTDALRERLVRTRVLLGTRVCGLDAGPGGTVDIRFERGGQTVTLPASAVILALPPRLLAATLRWSPALPAELSRHWADAPTWMAGQAKLVVRYATPFWRAAGLSGSAVSQAGPLAEVHDAADAEGRQAALFGFVGVAAPWRRRMGRQVLVDAAVAQLGRLFGPQALAPLSVHWQDWADEPETATPDDAQPATAHPAPLATPLPEPWHDRIHLAGSEFAPAFPGYLEGAVRAAERAVLSLMAHRHADPAGVFD